MQNNDIKSQLLQNFGFEPTFDQSEAISKLCDFIVNDQNNQIFVLYGYAGTGKTSLVSSLVKTLNGYKIPSMLMAPTGRAAKVFSSFSQKKAFTIHKSIYKRKKSGDLLSSFSLVPNFKDNIVFIVDEASMISSSANEQNLFGGKGLLQDMIDYCFSANNCRLILLGDPAQLPPVGSSISKALDISELQCYVENVDYCFLKQVVRQETLSGILFNATKIREQIDQGFRIVDKPQFTLDGFDDIISIKGGELIEALEKSYDKNGVENTLVICRSNKNANIYNNGIRSQIFWREEQISVGDMIMVVKNNYFHAKDLENTDFIANGDIAKITRIGKYQEMYGLHFANVDLYFADYDAEITCKIILDCLNSEGPSLSDSQNMELYQNVMLDYQHLSSKKEIYEAIKKDPFYNALQVKFAYAVTCHKSQGGQWDTVFIDQGYLTDEMIDREYLRWLYTAFTRATNKLYLVNFKDDFFAK